MRACFFFLGNREGDMNTFPNGPVVDQPGAQAALLKVQMSSGAGWLSAIAVLSLVNTIAAIANINWSFLIGICATEFTGAAASHAHTSTGKAIAIIASLIILGMYALFAIFARKGQSWAFILGVVFYGLDTVILLLLGLASGAMGDIIFNLAFHAYAIFRIASAIKPSLDLNKLIAEQKKAAYYGQQPQQPYYQPPTDPTKMG